MVVHDPSAEHDLVILPFDQYEGLVTTEHPALGDYDEYLLEEMSERELIDKINRDIAVWRSYQELNERERQAALLEDQLTQDPLPDPFEEDFSHRSEWHRVSDLVGERRLSQLQPKAPLEEPEGDPIQTYVPVEDAPRPRFIMPEASSVPEVDIPQKTSESEEIFEEEETLSDDENPVFLEEPGT